MLKTSKLETDRVTVSWKPPKEDGGSKVTGYYVHMRQDDTDRWTAVTYLGSFDTEYFVKKLKMGQKYFFSVAAENKVGIGKSAETDKAVVPQKKPGNHSNK